MRQVDSAYLKMLARMDYKAAYEFRLVDQHGKVYPIPSRAVLSAPASSAVDSGTWEMPVSIMASSMPRGVNPQQYHRIEVDRVVAGNRMPYFRGVIDEVRRGWRKESWAEVETIDLQAFGVLQRAKGYRVDSLRIDPVTKDGVIQLRGLGRFRTWTPGYGVSMGGTETIPYGGPVLGSVYAFTDSTLTTPYVEGVNYTVNASATPLKITWLTTPASSRVFWFDTVERFVIPYLSSGPSFITLPPGREYDDLYHTWVLDIDRPNNKLRVADRTGYDASIAITEDDYLAIVTAAGTEYILERGSYADAQGWIDMTDPIPLDVTVGDAVRLPTTEAIAAWDDDRIYQFWDGASGSGGAQEWNRTFFTVYPNLGIAVPVNRVWGINDEVYIDSIFPGGVGYIREDVDDNRIEEAVKRILTDKTGLFAASDVLTEPTGVYVKNRTWSGYDLSDVLAEAKDQAMSPNAYIHDTQDGKVTIKPYRQKAKADWVLRGIQSIEETDVPEPVTAVTVIAEASEPVNLAGEWLYEVGGAINPERLTDGNKDENLAATASVAEDGFGAVFKVPIPEPGATHPIIDSIRVTGTGLVTAYFAIAPDTGPVYAIPGYTFAPIESGTMEISADEIAKVVTDQAGYLVVYISPVTSGSTESSTIVTPATCSEIEILTRKAGWWRAALTDDTNLAPANNGPDEFGSIWRQPDPTKRMSYRYAPPDYLKRVQTLYPDKAREHVLSMTAISQQDTRDYAERWQDELLRAGKTYRVTAPYDDRAELGDTVLVQWKGFRKELFLWALEGPQDPRSPLATYTFIDYGL